MESFSQPPTKALNIPSSKEGSHIRFEPQEPLVLETTILAPDISTSSALEEIIPAMESTKRTEEAGASRRLGKKSKRQEPVRKSKCIVSKRPRWEAQEAISPPAEHVEAEPQSKDDVPLL
ncbi:uncharacterized protein A4U43_C03F14240 [Asparagus officinalis]|uniref:Uncharacterized protein n=1 Tax=Asparagus officinalis TaxID=4686 RepID=A0A5P1FAV6_ASPOF|nr:uncharacterized protein A4U43_C03F14240 [Asparagus officinalis]